MSGNLIGEYIPLLRVLSDKRFRSLNRYIITKSKSQLIRCLTEICYNLINNIIPVNRSTQNWIKNNKKDLKLLANPKISSIKKKRLLIKKTPDFLIHILEPSLRTLEFLNKDA